MQPITNLQDTPKYVKGIINLRGSIVETPHLTNDFNNRFIKNIGKVGNDIILILDSKKILTEDELEYITEIL